MLALPGRRLPETVHDRALTEESAAFDAGAELSAPNPNRDWSRGRSETFASADRMPRRSNDGWPGADPHTAMSTVATLMVDWFPPSFERPVRCAT